MRYAAALLVAVGVLCLAYAARAADDGPRPAARFVLWDETNNRPWTTQKGNQSITGATACQLAATEAAQTAESGTRFSCRRISK